MTLKLKLLKQLETHRHETQSGQTLANNLHVTRTAIFKTINSLKADGYDIISTKKGYQLAPNTDIITEDGIRAYLSQKLSTGAVHIYQTIDSTNEEAKRLLLKGAPHNTIILANEQTAGKGRLGRTFYSPAHTGIYLTLIIKPNLHITDAVLLTTTVAVAVCKAIELLTNKQPQIKWVNDIYLGDKKIGGILTEASTNFENGKVEHVIIGIGLNVKTENFPDELEDIADSLQTNSCSRNQLAAEIINQLTELYEQSHRESIIEQYKLRSNVLGRQIQFTQNGQTKKAVAIDIDASGGLIVELEDKSYHTLNSGEITIRKI